MRLSTSNSDPQAGQYRAALRIAIVAVMVGTAGLLVTAEIGARVLTYRVSANLTRIHNEALHAAAMGVESERSIEILMVGNSLLLQDVDMETLREGLPRSWDVGRFAIEATTYYDWYYGIRALLARGARPDTIVYCIEPRHLLISGLRTEMFAYYLMQPADLLSVQRSVGLTADGALDLALANASMFYALRKEVRQVFLQWLLPDFPKLTARLVRSPKPPVDPEELRTRGKERLAALRDEAAASRVRLALLVTPPLEGRSAQVLRELEETVGVPILMPMSNRAMSGNEYQDDGYHLNADGRKWFTELLLPLLKDLERGGPRSDQPDR